MKTALVFLSLMSLSCFADVMYSYTYVTRTHKCAVDLFVPTSGKVKTEVLCFKLSK